MYKTYIKHVETYYGEKFPPPEEYNPETYNNSPFTYASDTMGLSYCKKWIPISFGNFKASSRSSDLFGLINIIEGIETVKTKDNVKRTDGFKFKSFVWDLRSIFFAPSRNKSMSLLSKPKILLLDE